MTGLHFWAKGYCVSTIGYDEEALKRYIREQEEQDSNQMSFDIEPIMRNSLDATKNKLED
jgi:putative transposase